MTEPTVPVTEVVSEADSIEEESCSDSVTGNPIEEDSCSDSVTVLFLDDCDLNEDDLQVESVKRSLTPTLELQTEEPEISEKADETPSDEDDSSQSLCDTRSVLVTCLYDKSNPSPTHRQVVFRDKSVDENMFAGKGRGGRGDIRTVVGGNGPPNRRMRFPRPTTPIQQHNMRFPGNVYPPPLMSNTNVRPTFPSHGGIGPQKNFMRSASQAPPARPPARPRGKVSILGAYPGTKQSDGLGTVNAPQTSRRFPFQGRNNQVSSGLEGNQDQKGSIGHRNKKFDRNPQKRKEFSNNGLVQYWVGGCDKGEIVTKSPVKSGTGSLITKSAKKDYGGKCGRKSRVCVKEVPRPADEVPKKKGRYDSNHPSLPVVKQEPGGNEEADVQLNSQQPPLQDKSNDQKADAPVQTNVHVKSEESSEDTEASDYPNPYGSDNDICGPIPAADTPSKESSRGKKFSASPTRPVRSRIRWDHGRSSTDSSNYGNKHRGKERESTERMQDQRSKHREINRHGRNYGDRQSQERQHRGSHFQHPRPSDRSRLERQGPSGAGTVHAAGDDNKRSGVLQETRFSKPSRGLLQSGPNAVNVTVGPSPCHDPTSISTQNRFDGQSQIESEGKKYDDVLQRGSNNTNMNEEPKTVPSSKSNSTHGNATLSSRFGRLTKAHHEEHSFLENRQRVSTRSPSTTVSGERPSSCPTDNLGPISACSRQSKDNRFDGPQTDNIGQRYSEPLQRPSVCPTGWTEGPGSSHRPVPISGHGNINRVDKLSQQEKFKNHQFAEHVQQSLTNVTRGSGPVNPLQRNLHRFDEATEFRNENISGIMPQSSSVDSSMIEGSSSCPGQYINSRQSNSHVRLHTEQQMSESKEQFTREPGCRPVQFPPSRLRNVSSQSQSKFIEQRFPDQVQQSCPSAAYVAKRPGPGQIQTDFNVYDEGHSISSESIHPQILDTMSESKLQFRAGPGSHPKQFPPSVQRNLTSQSQSDFEGQRFPDQVQKSYPSVSNFPKRPGSGRLLQGNLYRSDEPTDFKNDNSSEIMQRSNSIDSIMIKGSSSCPSPYTNSGQSNPDAFNERVHNEQHMSESKQQLQGGTVSYPKQFPPSRQRNVSSPSQTDFMEQRFNDKVQQSCPSVIRPGPDQLETDFNVYNVGQSISSEPMDPPILHIMSHANPQQSNLDTFEGKFHLDHDIYKKPDIYSKMHWPGPSASKCSALATHSTQPHTTVLTHEERHPVMFDDKSLEHHPQQRLAQSATHQSSLMPFRGPRFGQVSIPTTRPHSSGGLDNRSQPDYERQSCSSVTGMTDFSEPSMPSRDSGIFEAPTPPMWNQQMTNNPVYAVVVKEEKVVDADLQGNVSGVSASTITGSSSDNNQPKGMDNMPISVWPPRTEETLPPSAFSDYDVDMMAVSPEEDQPWQDMNNDLCSDQPSLQFPSVDSAQAVQQWLGAPSQLSSARASNKDVEPVSPIAQHSWNREGAGQNNLQDLVASSHQDHEGVEANELVTTPKYAPLRKLVPFGLKRESSDDVDTSLEILENTQELVEPQPQIHEVSSSVEDVEIPSSGNEEMNIGGITLKPELARAIREYDYETTKEALIEIFKAVESGRDVYSESPNGQGKSVATILGILQNFSAQEDKVCAVFVSSRHRADEVEVHIQQLAMHMPEVQLSFLVGGFQNKKKGPSNHDKSEKQNENGNVVVCTPGKLKQLIDNNRINLQYVQHLVVFDCHTILHNKEMNMIFRACPLSAQMIMTSSEIGTHEVPGQLRNPVYVVVDARTTLNNRYVVLQEGDKNKALFKLLQDEIPEQKPTYKPKPWNQKFRVVIFVQSHDRCKALADFLNKSGWNALSLDTVASRRFARSQLAFKLKCADIVVIFTIKSPVPEGMHQMNLFIYYDMPRSINVLTTYPSSLQYLRQNSRGMIMLVDQESPDDVQSLKELDNKGGVQFESMELVWEQH